jgi:hypothetical protein
MPADGNCMFHAVADQLRQQRHCDACDASTLRARAVAHMRKNPDVFAAFVLEEFLTYLERMRRPGTWGDNAVLFAIACMLDVEVHVESAAHGTVTRVARDHAAVPRTVLTLRHDGTHYDSLV